MGAVSGIALRPLDYDARLAALRAAGVGLWDVFAETERPGSLDCAIVRPQANAREALAATLPRLAAIAFNGAAAARAGRKLLAYAGAPVALIDLHHRAPPTPSATPPSWRSGARWRRISRPVRAGDERARFAALGCAFSQRRRGALRGACTIGGPLTAGQAGGASRRGDWRPAPAAPEC